MMPDYCYSIKRDLNNIENNNQVREKFCDSSFLHEGFISAVSLLNDFMKILVGLGIVNHVIFKDFGSDCYGKK